MVPWAGAFRRLPPLFHPPAMRFTFHSSRFTARNHAHATPASPGRPPYHLRRLQPPGHHRLLPGSPGMPFVFEQPNLDVPEETHLYFDPGDGRLITFFVRPTRENDPTPNPE